MRKATVADTNDFNAQIIEEFRANGGKVGGGFEGAPMLLLTTVGAKSGATRVHPMMYLEEDGRHYVFASKAGADTHPDWFHNLVAHPEVTVEIGADTLPMRATPLEGSEPRLRRVRGQDGAGHTGRGPRSALTSARRSAGPPSDPGRSLLR
jgi:deazaflavin-dependent oxidoreductase (nitroreductase family)